MTENTHTKKLTLLKLSVLGFGIFSLPGILIMLIQVVNYMQTEPFLEPTLLSILQLVSSQITFIGFLILALGVYLYSLSLTDQDRKEGKQIFLLFLIFFIGLLGITIFGLFILLTPGDLEMASTISEIDKIYWSNNKYADWARLWGLLFLIIFIFLFVISLKFIAWFNHRVKQYSIDTTYAMLSVSVIYCLAAFFSFTAISILFPLVSPTRIDSSPFHMAHRMDIDLSDIALVPQVTLLQDAIEAQMICFILLLLGFVLQFFVGLRIFKKVNTMSSIKINV